MGVLAVAWAVFTGGCVTAPATHTGTYSASKVGDRASVAFEEVIATVQLAGRDIPVNLHVGLSVIANPKVVTTGNPYEVEGIVSRSEARVVSTVVRFLTPRRRVAVEQFEQLQQEIARVAHAAFVDSFQKWSEARDYDVETVVTSFYFTDLSVGRSERNRRW